MGTDQAGATKNEIFGSFIEVAKPAPNAGSDLVSSPFTPGWQQLPSFAARLLQGCRTFATLHEHAARLCGELCLGPEQVRAIHEQLSALAQAGFLVTPAQLTSYSRSQASAAELLPPIASVGIPTRDRPQSLQRCLTGYLESALQHGRTHDYVVIDDSQSAEARRANRCLLQSLRERYRREICYAGPEEKARYAETLIRQAGLPADAVEFGLLNVEQCPVATGCSRNALLLHTVGDLLLQIDDDTVCRLAATPGARPGLALSSQFDPTEFWLLAEDETVQTVDKDLLAIHESLLGKGPADWVSGPVAGAGLHWDQAGPSFFRKLGTGSARVLVTAAGLAGDSGMGSPLYFLSLAGASRARLLRSEGGYRHGLAHQQILRAVTGATICEGAFCMAPNLGLDNRQLLPPFLPVQRNQDGVFGVLLRTCFPGGFFGFFPWALGHQQPAPPSPSAGDSWDRALRFRSGQIIQALIRSFSLGPDQTDRAKSLRALGQALVELGSRPQPDFEGVFRLHLQKHLSLLAAQLDKLLRQFGGPGVLGQRCPARLAGDTRWLREGELLPGI